MSDMRAIRIEGGLFSSDTLELLARGEGPGQRPQDFGLDAGRSLSDDLAERFRDALHLWTVFQNRLARLPETDSAAAVTRDAWVIPFFSLLDYQIVANPRRSAADGIPFPVSHRAGDAEDAPPIHVVGARQELGRVAVAPGQPRMSPHALLQEHLNVSDTLWGIVTNGVVVRLLRTSTYLRRQAYVEFDLKTILEEQRFADFTLLFRLIHRSRLPMSSADAHACLLEQYYQRALEQGGRVRERLRDGVEAALRVLANGFLAHPANGRFRNSIIGSANETGMDAQAAELYRQTLRLVYRFLFLLVAEERGLMDDTGHAGGGGAVAMQRLYRDHYGIGRLGRLVNDRRAYDDHDDLWHGLRALWRILADERLAAILGVAPLNGDLFAPLTLDDCSIANRDLLEAIWRLTYYRERDDAPLRRVNYAALDVEELGSVYESLLDYHPVIEERGARLHFDLIAGSERKSTGSYYTPPELVQELVRSALAPVIQERLAQAKGAAARERALLSIRVLDPACGSGHFLLAAARRLGKELARIRTGEDEPAPEQVREAIRDVTAHCIYGVDKNPLAVELCKVALWLEAHSAGKPLTFLDHRIRCGDSLVGVVDFNPVRQGIPDAAFEPKEGDDRALARSAKRRNAAERGGQLTLRFDESADLRTLSRAARDLDAIPDDTPQHVRTKQQRFNALRQAQQALRLACDLWTAAFFQRLAPGEMIITSTTVADALEGRPVHGQAAGVAVALAAQHRFFHWALEFPEVFEAGGFDVILGNPPWERIKLQEQEFFASRDAQVVNAPNAAVRRRLIAQLRETNPTLWQEFATALRAAAAASQFLRGSGRFPLTGTGDINTYAVFAELVGRLLAPRGRAGIIVPTGIATDATTQRFFRDLTNSGRLVSLYDFENRQKLFPAVDSRMKFCLLTVRGAAGSGAADAAEFAFFCHSAADLRDEERRFTLTPEDFRLLNPNTGTAPIFRSRRDAELTKAIYRRVPPLVRDDAGKAGNPWGVEFMTMFHMANDSHLFHPHPLPCSHPHPRPLPLAGGGEEASPHSLPCSHPHPLPLPHQGGGVTTPPSPLVGARGQGSEGAPASPHELAHSLPHQGGGEGASPYSLPCSHPHPRPLPHQGGGVTTPPSPLVGEGGWGGEGAPAPSDRWSIPEALRRKMVEVARQFRKHPTRSEEMLWEALRHKNLSGIKVRRQQPIGPFVVDFYVSSHRLVIEVDGGVHATEQEADRRRQELLESLGLRFLRLPADLVERDLPRALEIIHRALEHPHPLPRSHPHPLPRSHPHPLPLPHQGGGEGASPHLLPCSHPHPLPRPQQGGGEGAPAASLVGAGGQGGVGTEYLPLYEAKLIHQFDHRWATYDGDETRDLTPAEKADPFCVVTPRYWVPAAEVEARLAAKGWTRPWLLGWRDITNATNERTVIAAVIPRVGVGHTLPLSLPRDPSSAYALLALLNSLVLDFVARQKIGGTHLTFNYLEQLPVLTPVSFAQPCPWAPAMTVGDFVRPRVLELTYTAWDLAPFARDLGYDGPPFRFDPERRFVLRCELDAAFFHLYLPAEADGSWKRATNAWAVVAETDDDLARLTALFPTPRDAAAYILDQFPIVRRKDEAQFGVYRTKETILAIYDAMQAALRQGAAGG